MENKLLFNGARLFCTGFRRSRFFPLIAAYIRVQNAVKQRRWKKSRYMNYERKKCSLFSECSIVCEGYRSLLMLMHSFKADLTSREIIISQSWIEWLKCVQKRCLIHRSQMGDSSRLKAALTCQETWSERYVIKGKWQKRNHRKQLFTADMEL